MPQCRSQAQPLWACRQSCPADDVAVRSSRLACLGTWRTTPVADARPWTTHSDQREQSGAVKGDYAARCSWPYQARGDLLGIVAFSGAPEQWHSMVNEYHSLRGQAIRIIEPVHAVCQAGGGVVSGEVAQQIIDFFDMAQNRMYEMLQQAQAMTQ